MNGNEEGKRPTLDERLTAVALSLELASHNINALQELGQTHERRLVAAEKEQRRLRHAMRVALEAWVNYDDEAGQ